MPLDSSEIDFTLKIANGFCSETQDVVYCLEEDAFYMYEDGVYKKIFTREMHQMVLTRKILTQKMTLQGLRNVVERIATIKKTRLDRFNCDPIINFENGIFNLTTFTLEAHNNKYLSTMRIPYEYSHDASSPLWEKTINEIMDNDKNKIRTIQEFFGYCLTREVKYEKALVMTGEGGTGKSTIINTLKHLVGLDNCSALSLRYFSDPQKTSVLKSKLLNICTEVPKKIEDYEAEFRSIVTGEELTISPKYIADYKIMPYCKLVMAINEFPYIDDKTSAFYRRLLLIELKREFKEEEQNKDLKNQLLKELPGIFNWSIEGLKRLQERNTFLIDEYMRLSIDSLKEMNNPIIQWAKENICISTGAELIKGEAFTHYKKWCETNGYRPIGLAKFGAEIYRIFKKTTEKDRRSSDGDRPRIWPHLELKKPYHDHEQVQWQQPQ